MLRRDTQVRGNMVLSDSLKNFGMAIHQLLIPFLWRIQYKRCRAIVKVDKRLLDHQPYKMFDVMIPFG